MKQSSSFVSSLISKNLIDEYYLLVNPTAIANGMAVFSKVEGKLNLALVKATTFDCGIVALCYKPAGR
jgi:dihydrofolate reductase